MECVYAALFVVLWDGRCNRARVSHSGDGSEDVTLFLVLGFGAGFDCFSTLLPNPAHCDQGSACTLCIQRCHECTHCRTTVKYAFSTLTQVLALDSTNLQPNRFANACPSSRETSRSLTLSHLFPTSMIGTVDGSWSLTLLSRFSRHQNDSGANREPTYEICARNRSTRSNVALAAML